jgi:cell division protein YceG involved in septum cleavage
MAKKVLHGTTTTTTTGVVEKKDSNNNDDDTQQLAMTPSAAPSPVTIFDEMFPETQPGTISPPTFAFTASNEIERLIGIPHTHSLV